ncbi:MAG: tRNA (adenosine(37)-N6)-threonylcarbamoyltransferase complex ATPase subunit type 1 TsaE [Anaerolineae bacterium]
MPILKPGTLEFISHSVDQTSRLGFRLGELLRPGDVICLYGELGAGKTAFARGLGKGWGAVPAVTSPTFVLVHEHTRAVDDLRLYHVDAYRLADADEALTFGLDEMFLDPNPLLIEWPERVAELLPAERLDVYLTFQSAERRQITFEAHGDSMLTLLDAFRRRTFGA